MSDTLPNEVFTVARLKAMLERLRDEDRLVVPVKTMAGSVGPKPCVAVTGVYSGIDWDRGKLMIGTAEPLHVAGDVYQEEQKRARDKGEALAFLWMTASDKRLTDAQKLTAFRATLKRFGFNTPEPQP